MVPGTKRIGRLTAEFLSPLLSPATRDQWLIIHGRADGNRLLPSAPFTVRLGKAPAFDPVLQHEQLMPCPPLLERGACALRSFTSIDLRSTPDIDASDGALISTRGEAAPQAGHAAGSW